MAVDTRERDHQASYRARGPAESGHGYSFHEKVANPSGVLCFYGGRLHNDFHLRPLHYSILHRPIPASDGSYTTQPRRHNSNLRYDGIYRPPRTTPQAAEEYEGGILPIDWDHIRLCVVRVGSGRYAEGE